MDVEMYLEHPDGWFHHVGDQDYGQHEEMTDRTRNEKLRILHSEVEWSSSLRVSIDGGMSCCLGVSERVKVKAMSSSRQTGYKTMTTRVFDPMNRLTRLPACQCSGRSLMHVIILLAPWGRLLRLDHSYTGEFIGMSQSLCQLNQPRNLFVSEEPAKQKAVGDDMNSKDENTFDKQHLDNHDKEAFMGVGLARCYGYEVKEVVAFTRAELQQT
ncbi:hypothetical protein Cgig2_010999 [Carnegiea gigantea]|uniref:Uncharacterized protein n=1 Tax=Carnegiea gigantea TaxID=171969 RepID=A0A9Q1KFT7_9CARY|nr:hypothetical protein Cgig2_010999 [Carnegiea gigantea]